MRELLILLAAGLLALTGFFDHLATVVGLAAVGDYIAAGLVSLTASPLVARYLD